MKNALLHDYRMWIYQETIMGERILFGHLTIDFMIMLIVYPATLLIYLGRYPSGWWKQLLWTALWIMLYTSIEYVNFYYLDLIYYDHGWNTWWSLLFNIVMFSILRIHQLRPLAAWGISLIWIIFLLKVFHIPASVLE